MMTKRALGAGAAIAAAVMFAALPTALNAQQTLQSAVRLGEHDLGGVVTGRNGPEAGVW